MSQAGKRFSIFLLIVLFGFLGGLISARTAPLAAAGETASGPAARTSDNVQPGARALADQLSSLFEEASSEVSPAVVPIFAESTVEVRSPFGSPDDAFRQFFGEDFFKRFFGDQGAVPETVRSLGSGVIVSSDGYILTNNHVVTGAQKLTVMLGDNRKLSAKVIGTDPQTDVAVIKVEARDLPVANLGSSDQVKVGQWVIAVGNPFGLMHTVTSGIISAKGRSSVGLAAYEDFIQTDASINPGNSGGALADLSGKVIGINTAISSPSGGNVGIGFAIPIDMAKHVMDELIKTGKVSRGYLGLLPQDLDENLAKALKLKVTRGVLVGDVVPNGPSEKAGIHRGDVILAVNGEPVKNSVELRNRIADLAPGSTVPVHLLRDGREMDVTAKLGERPAESAGGPESQMPGGTSHKLGLSVQSLTPELARQLGYPPDEKGVLVADVAPGSAAEDAGIERGDVIREVNRTSVSSPQELVGQLEKLSSGDTAAFLISRGPNTFYVPISIP